MHLPDPTALATPAFVLLIAVEMLFVRATGRGRYETYDTATSLSMGFGSVVMGGLLAILFVAVAKALGPYRIASLSWSVPVVAVAFVLDDLKYYWWHRASHRIRWLWADHVQHHSSQHYNLTTALRQPITSYLAPGVLFNAPMLILGFPPAMIGFVGGLNLVYQFWIHTETIQRCPAWFEAVMNTPSHHRVHHATNARYLDSNYAGVFIVWDKLFGTFVAERADDPPRYGIVKNLGTFNPLRVALHEWVGMLSDMAKARSPREAALYLLAPPGWSPDGSRETTDTIKAAWAGFARTE